MPESTTITIRVRPKSSRPGIGPWRADADGRLALEVRVAAAPTDGEANAAVVKLIAKSLGLGRSAVRIVAGETSRHKRVAIELGEAELGVRIAAISP